MAVWDRIVTDEEREVLRASGFGGRVGFGARPVVFVIDVNYAFCGDRSEPILESIERWPYSCGEEAWRAIPMIVELLRVARSRDVPVFYTTGESMKGSGLERGLWRSKCLRDAPAMTAEIGNDIVAEISPQDGDVVVVKAKSSAFFGTPLISYLNSVDADTILVCGTTTSGCVRATVTDGFSLNYRMAVIEECTFDRVQTSHLVNLMDIDQKYGDVVTLATAIDYLKSDDVGRHEA